MRTRPAVPDDDAAVAEVITRAFGEEEGPVVVRLLDLLAATGHLRASLVAEDDDGAALGHVALSRSWVDARAKLVEVLVPGPLSVRPESQGRGAGAALVAAALERATALEVPAVFLEGNPDFYGGRGFARASAVGFTRPSVRIPDAAFQVALLPAHEPWMTGALVYCDPVWALDCVGLRDPRLAELEATPP